MATLPIPGTVITFKYSGGSNPNAETRYVYVTDIDSTVRRGFIKGWCFERNDYRNFSRNKMKGITQYPYHCTAFSVFPKALNLSDLVTDYLKENRDVFLDVDNQYLVEISRPVSRYTATGRSLHISSDKMDISISLGNGSDAALHLGVGNRPTVVNPSADQLIEALRNL